MTRGGNSASHRASRDIGEQFESWVNVQHEMAGLRGALAHVVHNMPPSKFVHGRLIYEEAGVADYSGVLHGVGQVLAAEAKSVAPGARLARSRISPKQAQHLDAVEAAGGLALLLVEFREEGLVAPHHRFVIPWHQVMWKVIKTAESLDKGDIAYSYRIDPGTDYLARFHSGSNRRYTVGERRMSRVYRTE